MKRTAVTEDPVGHSAIGTSESQMPAKRKRNPRKRTEEHKAKDMINDKNRSPAAKGKKVKAGQIRHKWLQDNMSTEKESLESQEMKERQK